MVPDAGALKSARAHLALDHDVCHTSAPFSLSQLYMASKTTPPFVTSLRSAGGNVGQDTKDALAEAYGKMIQKRGFANAVASRLEATELSMLDKLEEKDKKEAKVVFEIDVLDGACSP